MAFSEDIKTRIYGYCNKHLPEETKYEEDLDFIEDEDLRERLIAELKGTRFAYKLYEGISAQGENLIFEVRHQILSYASIYEAIIHYVLFTYYSDTIEFHNMQYHLAPTKIDIPETKRIQLREALIHDGKDIIPYYMKEKKVEDSQIRFDSKCDVCVQLGLLHSIVNNEGQTVDLVQQIKDIYSYRNAIHIMAERRKGIDYELDMSKRAYWRIEPFIAQIKSKLKEDKKGIYA